jgi:hypothetical protein
MTQDEMRALADELEIRRKLYLYARAIDGKRFELFDEIFTQDAEIHYDVDGGTKLPQLEMRAWLGEMLQMFHVTQHAVANPIIDVHGDHARSTCYLVATHEQLAEDGRRAVFMDHGIYADEWVRTASGWRSVRRRLSRFVFHGDFIMPDECRKFASPPKPALGGRD